MNFDRAQQLLQELQKSQRREAEIRQELAAIFAEKTTAPTAGVTGLGAGKSTRKSKKGELTALVTSLLKGYTRPAKLDTIAKRVQAQRPGTTQASVATALHALVRKNVVVKPEPSTFQLLKTPAAPAVEKQAKPARKAQQEATMPAPEPAPRPEPAHVREEDGVLIES